MAGFKTHLTGGVIVGASCAAISLTAFQLNYIQAVSVFVMGAIGGILPDIDSDSGKPLALIFGTISVLVPVLMLEEIGAGKHLTPEFLVSYFVISYIIINYVVCGMIKAMTAHRGIIHSLPFSVFAGEIGYLLFLPSGNNVATIVAAAVFSGSLVHLLLDELHSLSFKYMVIPVVKNSFGTALKMRSSHALPTATMYVLTIMAAFLISKS